jgi:hypothetical protein
MLGRFPLTILAVAVDVLLFSVLNRDKVVENFEGHFITDKVTCLQTISCT